MSSLKRSETIIANELRARAFIYEFLSAQPEAGPTTRIAEWKAIDYEPEGVEVGSPGDGRIRVDIGQLWIKVSGVRTATGWLQLGEGQVGPAGPAGPQGPEGPAGAAGAPGGDILDVTNSINFVVATSGGSIGFVNTPAPLFQGVPGANVLLLFGQTTEETLQAIWQRRTPPSYTAGDPITLIMDFCGDGSAAADASFSAQLERDTNFNVLGGSSFGSPVNEVVPISGSAGISTTVEIAFTSPAQRDGLQPNEPFRINIVRNNGDAYGGDVYFIRGLVEYG